MDDYDVKLNDYAWMKTNADKIYARLAKGDMPPKDAGGAWPADKVQLFKQWKDGGCQP